MTEGGRSITINVNEAIAIGGFVAAHQRCTKDKYPTRFEVTAVSNGIADSLTIRCLDCGSEKSVSDIGSW